MSFNLPNSGYQIISGYWALNVPVIGGLSPYSYSYPSLPPGWMQSQNILNIPLAVTSLGGTFPINCIVTDKLGNQFKQTLLIKISGSSIFLGSYSYGTTFPNSSNMQSSSSSSSASGSSLTPAISSFVLPPLAISRPSASNVNTFGTTTSSAGVINLSKQKGSNNQLPTSDQLDQLINSGDIVSITQTIQAVIASSFPCDQKVGYLNNFVGRILSYIQIKGSQADQQQSIITNAQKLINSLNDQIANYTTSSASLNIPNLQNQLMILTLDLQKAYDEYNTINIDLTPYNLNITANLQSINELSGRIDFTTNQIRVDNQALSQTALMIKQLQIQLANANKNKGTLEARILQGQSYIGSTQLKIDQFNAQNIVFNNKINSISSDTSKLQSNYQSLETQAQNLKTKIYAYQVQQKQYTTQISSLKAQVQNQTPNLDTTTLTAINHAISSLKGALPALNQQIDYVKFNCQGSVNYTVNTLNGAITYTFGQSAFSSYFTNSFGLNNANSAQSIFGPLSNVTLIPISIFSNNWVNLYGKSFQTDISLANSIGGSYQFNSDFSCVPSSTIVSNSGIITNINQNLIQAKYDNGKTMNLQVGACSSILLMNQNVPKVGYKIYWRGRQPSPSSCEVLNALIF